jgi:hypothetical protein
MSTREPLAHDQIARSAGIRRGSAVLAIRSAAPLVSIAGGILLLLALGHSWWELILVAAFGLVAMRPALMHDTAVASGEVETPDVDPASDPGAGRAVLAGLDVVEGSPRGDAVDRER